MRLLTALKVIQKEMEFMGMSSEKVLDFIQKNPLAVSQKTLEAFKVYTDYQEIIEASKKEDDDLYVEGDNTLDTIKL
jgi:hypothetical protein